MNINSPGVGVLFCALPEELQLFPVLREGSSYFPATLSPQDLMPASSLCGHLCTCGTCTLTQSLSYTQSQHTQTLTHIYTLTYSDTHSKTHIHTDSHICSHSHNIYNNLLHSHIHTHTHTHPYRHTQRKFKYKMVACSFLLSLERENKDYR